MKVPKNDEPDIVFSERDSRGIKQPHDSPLVIMLRVEEFNTHRLLINNGSSADIIYLSAFQQMKLDKKRIKAFASPLVSFIGDRIVLKGIVTLTVIARTYPVNVTKEIDFLIVDCPSTYNIILGRPALNRLKVVTSTYHLKVKFLIAHGVGKIRGDQVLAKECYQAALTSGENHTWVINSETPQEVEIIPRDLTMVLKIETTLPTSEKEKMISFLRENQDVFTWKHEDMLGIDRKIIQHHPNINPERKLVQ